MIEMALANTEDLGRLAWLEAQGYFAPGFTLAAFHQVNRYMQRIWFLYTRRLLPGCPPYPGPRET